MELVCDNQFPVPFGRDGGLFTMDPGSFINTGTGYLHIYTVQPNQNTINGLLNGFPFGLPLFVPANFFDDTCFEQWCTYYCAGIPTTCSGSLIPPAVPFTIAYKICMNIINGPGAQPPKIVSQFLVDLHPYNEFPGWMMRFWIEEKRQPLDAYPLALYAEPYMLRRRHLNVVNHPKTWTQQNEDTHPRPLSGF